MSQDDGVEWYFLEHKGPLFPPPYTQLPYDVKLIYDGKRSNSLVEMFRKR